MLALAVVALGACTSDDVAVNQSENKIMNGGDGYVSLSINLPTQSSSRAANDVFDDGLASEYAVNNATLLLFAGESEEDAAYYAKYELTTEWDRGETDQITTKAQLTQKIETPESGDIFALVVLNNNGLLNDISEGATLSDLQTTVQALGGVGAMTGHGLYMANAPLISLPGGISSPAGGTVSTLTPIDADKIYATEAEAASAPATAIHVERGMSKVTVVEDEDFTAADDLGEVSIDGFTLDLTNNVSYLVRNTTTASAEQSGATWWGLKSGSSEVGDADLYRFAGGVQVAVGLYRTYWAEDPNYDTTPNEGDLNSIEGTTPELGGIGEENPQYCLENTFSVAHMNQNETTRAIVGATLFGGADFYVWGGDKNNPLMDEADVEENILGAFYGEIEVRNALDSWAGAADGYREYLSVEFVDDEGTKLSDLESSDDLQFAIVFDGAGINASSFGGTLPDVFDATSEAYKTVMAELNASRTVAYYKGGLAYYPILIKHFGDDLTPWDIAEVEGQGYGSSYPDGIYSTTADNNWLGRYGMLRNNWYEINVRSISNIGSATVPTAESNPDDPTEAWISIEINMLSWAKRIQDADL